PPRRPHRGGGVAIPGPGELRTGWVTALERDGKKDRAVIPGAPSRQDGRRGDAGRHHGGAVSTVWLPPAGAGRGASRPSWPRHLAYARQQDTGVPAQSAVSGVVGQSSSRAPITATCSVSASAGTDGSRPVRSLTRASREVTARTDRCRSLAAAAAPPPRAK